MTTVGEAEVDLAKVISTPSNLGVHLGDQIWSTGWQPYPFLLDAEREIIPACFRDTEQDWFMLSAPNQIGKSTLAILLIFWYIGMFPDRQVIFISYSDGYSSEAGRLVRDLFKAHGERLFGLVIDPDNDSQGDWSLLGHPSGGMLSVGIGGQITGRQGWLVWIDDILRTMIEAASVTTKEAHWNEWKGTIWGRRQPGSVYVVAATRLAEDDLSGRLQKEQDQGGGIPWVRLIYPGICEPPSDYDGKPEEYRDRLGRKVGEPLVTRFSKPDDTTESNWWTKAREQMGNPQLFDCMVQQNPANDEAGMFPEDRWVKILREDWPERLMQCRGWDLAESEGKGDYTCGTLVGKSADGTYFIEGRYRERVGPDKGIMAVKDIARTDGHGIPILIEQEKGGAAKKLVEFYRQHLEGYMVEPSPTDGTKEMRAATYSILQKGGRIVLPADDEDAEWVEMWIREHKGMMGDGRRPRHDDTIDSAAHAVRWLAARDFGEYADPNDMDIEEMLALDEMLAELGL